MSQRDTKPLSERRLFSKGVSIFYNFFFSPQNQIAHFHFFTADSLCTENVIKRFLNMHLLVAKDCMNKTSLISQNEMLWSLQLQIIIMAKPVN